MRTTDKISSSASIQELRKRWLDFCKRLKTPAIPRDYCIEIFEQLHMHYSKRSRTYHNWSHIIRCLIEFNKIKGHLNHVDEVEMALWFHDVIYEPEKGDNEEKSANWAVIFSKKIGQSDLFAQRVRALILATTHQEIPPDQDAQFVMDIDLSILGQPKDIFLQYEEAIRKEYSAVEDNDFKKQRARILHAFFKRDFIYLTDFYQEKYEDTARKNLKHSIDRLKT